MNSDFSKVSLGFAEFISQLIHETSDAILDSQFYQIEKISEIKQMLELSNNEFRAKFILDSEFIIFQENLLGFKPELGLKLTEVQILNLNELLNEDELNIISKESKLTNLGLEVLIKYCEEKIVQLKKSKIILFLNQSEMSRISIDSGEIRTKLDLSFLNENIYNNIQEDSTIKTKSKLNLEADENIKSKNTSFEIKELDFSRMKSSSNFSNLKAKEVIDKESGLKTILIDKESLINKEVNFNIPTTRIIANPINASISSNISSEVIIKFKTI